MRRLCTFALAAAVLAACPATAPAAKKKTFRPVLTVGNNWAGTADIVDP